MKVFISWSGPKSMAVANLLKKWVKYVLQTSSPWVSTHDIEQGRVAMTQLFETLNEAKIGIICLTPKNHEKPWILFEAGAISSKFDESRVLTLLLDGLDVSNLKPPLGLFQATNPDEEGMKSLLWRINLLLATPLDRDIFEAVFQTYWPQFESEYQAILESVTEDGPVIKREEGEKLDEILKSVRSFDKRVRNLEEGNYNNVKKNILLDSALSTFLQNSDRNTLSSTDIAIQLIKKFIKSYNSEQISNQSYYDEMIAELNSVPLSDQVRNETISLIVDYLEKSIPPKPRYSTIPPKSS